MTRRSVDILMFIVFYILFLYIFVAPVCYGFTTIW